MFKKKFLLLFIPLLCSVSSQLSFAQDLNSILSRLVYDANESYESGRSVMLSIEDGEIYTSTKLVPAAADGSNAPKTANAIANNYWGDQSTTTASFEASNPGFASSVPSDINTTALSQAVADLVSPGNSLSNYNGTPIIARLNVRGHIGTGDDERFMAFKLTGSADVMVRAVGDALSAYSLTNLLVDPEMRLYKYNDANDLSAGSTEQTAGSNDNYTTHAQSSTIVSEAATIFPAITLQSSEAASLTTLSSGYYSNQVFDKSYSASNGSRIGWVGVDMTSNDGSATFTSVATRGIVKPGDGAMFAGFEIIGDSSQTRKIFVRGRGASLADFGVSNVMSDAQLQLFRYTNAEKTESELIQLNDNYTSQSNASEIAAKAKELLNVDLQATDPGMILDLAPGYYTIQFESADGATGNGWIGIDDITE